MGLSLLVFVSCTSSVKRGREDSGPGSPGTMSANMQESEAVSSEPTQEGNITKIPVLRWNEKKNAPVKTTSYGFVTATLDDTVYVLVLESPSKRQKCLPTGQIPPFRSWMTN